MRQCKKCSLMFEEPTKICRSCGAILDEVVGETAPAMDTVVEDWLHAETAEARQSLTPIEEISLGKSPSGAEWDCPHCKESVPAEFDTCWNCGTSQNGAVQPAIPDRSADVHGERVGIHCPACGSAKMIPDAHVCDQGQHSGGQLLVVVYGAPDAILFKDRLHGAVTADICGDCGYLQLRVQNAAELYERYLRSLE